MFTTKYAPYLRKPWRDIKSPVKMNIYVFRQTVVGHDPVDFIKFIMAFLVVELHVLIKPKMAN